MDRDKTGRLSESEVRWALRKLGGDAKGMLKDALVKFPHEDGITFEDFAKVFAFRPLVTMATLDAVKLLEGAQKLLDKQEENRKKRAANAAGHMELSNALNSAKQDEDAVRAAMDAERNKSTEMKAKLQQTEQDYEQMKAALARTKESLEAALQAQEAYRKECHAVKEALQKQKGELDKQGEELALSQFALGGCDEARDKMKWEIHKIKERQRENTQKVLARVSAGNDSALVALCFSNLVQNVQSEKHDRQVAAEAAKLEAKMKEMMAGQTEKAKAVMDRMNAGNNSALTTKMFKCWVMFVEDEKKMREHDAEAAALKEKMNSMLKDQNDKAKAVMDRMNAGKDEALVAQQFKAWKTYLEDAKANGEMEAQIQKAKDQLKESMKESSGKARKVMERMGGSSETGLLVKVFAEWAQYIRDARDNQDLVKKLDATVEQAHVIFMEWEGYKNIQKEVNEQWEAEEANLEKAKEDLANKDADIQALKDDLLASEDQAKLVLNQMSQVQQVLEDEIAKAEAPSVK
eukprot:gnl/TRDRNA2_/TRDRNA2_35442_c0_seq1.p1 gnl/TRDRNA2_/TRDRNA2_35442_c0~~gnl/TRDRNA2_/TRDRNA2_35442_c0_seq1.p1  ORF type:complete len:575 (+),score=182.90 gnl/TRDRNA2_/TRDRNA2_35442_c0_seq1:167-1726(+)